MAQLRLLTSVVMDIRERVYSGVRTSIDLRREQRSTSEDREVQPEAAAQNEGLQNVDSVETQIEEVQERKKRKVSEYQSLVRNLTTIDSIYKEYDVGVMGRRSIREMEKDYKEKNIKWWGNEHERKTFFRRLRICKVVDASLERVHDLPKVLKFWESCCKKYFKNSVNSFSAALGDSSKNPTKRVGGDGLADPMVVKCWEEFEELFS